jgi:hypothetical protein
VLWGKVAQIQDSRGFIRISIGMISILLIVLCGLYFIIQWSNIVTSNWLIGVFCSAVPVLFVLAACELAMSGTTLTDFGNWQHSHYERHRKTFLGALREDFLLFLLGEQLNGELRVRRNVASTNSMLALFTTFITVWFTAITDSYTQEYTNTTIPFTDWIIPYAGRATFTTVGVTATVLILGEILPKQIAIRHGLRVLLILWFVPALIYLCLLVIPFSLHWVLRWMGIVH